MKEHVLERGEGEGTCTRERKGRYTYSRGKDVIHTREGRTLYILEREERRNMYSRGKEEVQLQTQKIH